MGRNFKNMAGEKFGELVVLEFFEKNKEKYFWVCKCSCGNYAIVDGSKLRDGMTKSCGCLQIKMVNKIIANTLDRQNKNNSLVLEFFNGKK